MKSTHHISKFNFTPKQLSKFERDLIFEKTNNFVYIFKIKVLYREFYKPFYNNFFSNLNN